MFRNQEGPCQVYPLGMGNVDEDITAMLQGSHATLSQASLAGVMAPTDQLTSFPSTQYLHYQGNLSPASAASSAHNCRRQASASSSGQPARSQGFLSNVRTPSAPPSNSSNNSNRNRRVVVPPSAESWVPNFQADEKWLMDAKSEVLDAAAMMQQQQRSSDMPSFYDSPVGVTNLNPAVLPGSLHRYHSAPSAFLQGLAEFNEDAFSSQVSNSMVDSAMPPLFSDGGGGGGGLTPITEGMDVDRLGSGGSLSEFEQFISPDSDFSRRAAMSALGKPEGNADSFGRNFPAPKSGLLRQKSLPSATVAHAKATRQDRIDEIVSEESISGTSEDNELVNNGMKGSASGMFAQDDFLRDTLTSWQSPPSPGPGKRQRGLPGESDTSSGSAEGSITFHTGQQLQRGAGGGGANGLIRHMSLPTNADPTSPDDYVQMRTRAKRGCATHPRSIAERVRRTKISERMRKLQDLVPNMDKQTNTSDMLDETVEYVRSLQMKVKELTDTVAQLKAAEQQKKSIITTA